MKKCVFRDLDGTERVSTTNKGDELYRRRNGGKI